MTKKLTMSTELMSGTAATHMSGIPNKYDSQIKLQIARYHLPLLAPHRIGIIIAAAPYSVERCWYHGRHRPVFYVVFTLMLHRSFRNLLHFYCTTKARRAATIYGASNLLYRALRYTPLLAHPSRPTC